MTDHSDDMLVSNYVAAFIDVLGQRAALHGCGLLPASLEEFLPVARSSIGVIQQLHESFAHFYDAFHTPADPSLVPDALKERFQASQKTEVGFQRFSDGLVVYAPLMEEEGYLSITDVYGLLAASGALCLLGLSIRQPLRGGIDLAWGVELNHSELYGCVVAKSYELESNVAEYPRIVIGDELIRYFDAYQDYPGQTPEAELIRTLATWCKEMTTIDEDGVPIIHYLGPRFRENLIEGVDPSIFTDAAAYVEEQLDRWVDVGDEKLVSRYRRLQSYFNENRGTWET
jgi:hypothetical protein